MNLTLKTKITSFITIVVIIVSSVSTWLFIHAYNKSIEREVTARGVALAEALARSVDEGLALENLDLIKHFEDIVHTKDVVLAQVFSTLWLAVASVPAGELNIPPDSDAVRHFKKANDVHDNYCRNQGRWIDVYHPVFFNPHDERVPKVLIGYVRVRISTERAAKAAMDAVIVNLVASAALTLFVVILLNLLMRKYLLLPILDLHRSIARHKQGDYSQSVPVCYNDEIGELTAEFNAMSRALQEREQRLAEEKERLAVTLRSIGDGVIVSGVDGIITLINRVAEEHTGWPAREAVGRHLPEVFHIVNEMTGERCEQPAETALRTGLTSNHTALIRRDGSRIIIEDSAAPIRDSNSVIVGVVLVFRDVTEKRRMEEEIIKAEKLQSVGLLAGGLAHDFNNLLTVIMGNISIAQMYIDAGNTACDRLADAEKASRRAADLTYQLLTFSKGGAPVKRAASIADILRESSTFALSGTRVASEFVIEEGIWTVDVDAGQMSQVFNNLIINAVHAMPDGGTIRFIASNRTLVEKEVPTLQPGRYVKISIQDRGTGIPPEHLSRIFDPYFTTKQKGSGLGLTSVYSIINRHDGHIAVESRKGQGTTFHIYLPAFLGKKLTDREEDAITRGHGSVLLMDDEKLVRDVAAEMLRTLGYSVDCAQNGDEAIELYKKSVSGKKGYDLVIMDLTIPGGMGGKEALGKLIKIDPRVKAVVSSGYSNDPVMADFARYGFCGVITKPYSIAGFSEALREAMKGKSTIGDREDTRGLGKN